MVDEKTLRVTTAFIRADPSPEEIENRIDPELKEVDLDMMIEEDSHIRLKLRLTAEDLLILEHNIYTVITLLFSSFFTLVFFIFFPNIKKSYLKKCNKLVNRLARKRLKEHRRVSFAQAYSMSDYIIFLIFIFTKFNFREILGILEMLSRSHVTTPKLHYQKLYLIPIEAKLEALSMSYTP